jgi:FMN-dependent NADH-azoreductase
MILRQSFINAKYYIDRINSNNKSFRLTKERIEKHTHTKKKQKTKNGVTVCEISKVKLNTRLHVQFII